MHITSKATNTHTNPAQHLSTVYYKAIFQNPTPHS